MAKDFQQCGTIPAYAQSDQSLCLSLEYSMIGGFLSLKGDCTGSSESTLVKMPHSCKSHVTAHITPSATPCDKIIYIPSTETPSHIWDSALQRATKDNRIPAQSIVYTCKECLLKIKKICADPEGVQGSEPPGKKNKKYRVI